MCRPPFTNLQIHNPCQGGRVDQVNARNIISAPHLEIFDVLGLGLGLGLGCRYASLRAHLKFLLRLHMVGRFIKHAACSMESYKLTLNM